MSINKNDCMDCCYSIKITSLRDDSIRWTCNNDHNIPQDENGIVDVLDEDCKDFGYQE